MKLLLSIVSTSMLGSLAFSTMALSENTCANIDNDIARLECYDKTFGATSENDKKSIEEAYAEFAAFTQLDNSGPDGMQPGDEALVFAIEDCHFRSTWSRLKTTSLKGKPNLLVLYYTDFDLKEVKSIQSALTGQHAQVSMNRGETVRAVSAEYFVRPGDSFNGYLADAVGRTVTKEEEGFWRKELYNKRSMRTRISVEKEDWSQSFELFSNLVEACQNE